MTDAWETDFDALSELARRAQKGDRAAYETFLTGLYPWVKAVIRRTIGGGVDVDDLTQACLLGIHQSLASYHPSRNLKPWLNAIVRYKTIDYFRACARAKEIPMANEDLDVTSADPGTNTEDEEPTSRRVMVRVLVLRLPADLRQAVVLTRFRGLSTEEAARREGISPAALRKRVSRAYRRLARMIEKEENLETAYGRG